MWTTPTSRNGLSYWGHPFPTRFVSTNTNNLFQSIWGDLSLAVAVRKFVPNFHSSENLPYQAIRSVALTVIRVTVRYGPVRHRWQIQGKVDRTDGWCSQPFANLTRRKSTIALTFRGTKARLG